MTLTPKTLLQFAGAPRHPSPIANAAILIIDAQREYVEGGLPLAGIVDAIAETARLLAFARKNGAPVFHIVHHAKPGAPLFNPEGPFAAIASEVEPHPGERIIVKSLPNSFAKTELHEAIQATGRKELIIAGFATHMCVAATTMAALDLGYRNTIVAGAVATRDLPDALDGRTVPAEVLHHAVLAGLADRFAIVVRDTAALEAAAISAA